MMYPFVYHLDGGFNGQFSGGIDLNLKEGQVCWVVKIAKYSDYTTENTEWMDCSVLGKQALVPALDIEESCNIFDTERDALLFVQEWWSEQKI